MPKGGDKKLVPLQLADILKNGHEGGHRFSQKRLQEIMLEKHGVELHRDTIKANLDLLRDFYGDAVQREEGKLHVYWSWHEPEPEPVFEASQARYLADSVISARRIKPKDKDELVGLIMENSDADPLPWDYVLANVRMGSNAPAAANPDYFLSVCIVAECLRDGCQLAFRFGEVDWRGRFVKMAPDEEVGPVVPLFLVMSNGSYHLACRFPGEEKTYHYRLDFMHDPRKVEAGCGAGALPVDLERYRAEHPYMFTDAVDVTVRIPDTPSARVHFFDVFGGREELLSDEGGRLVYKVRGNKKAMRIWACQFADEVEVLAPQDIRDEVAKTAAALKKLYSAKPDWEGAK